MIKKLVTDEIIDVIYTLSKAIIYFLSITDIHNVFLPVESHLYHQV